MFYTGIDQHKRDSYLATYDDDGRLVKQGRVRNSRAALAVGHRGVGLGVPRFTRGLLREDMR